MDSNLRQLSASTTADSNRNLLDCTSMILILKEVWFSKVRLMVSQWVSGWFRVELIWKAREVKLTAKVSVTMISLSSLSRVEHVGQLVELAGGGGVSPDGALVEVGDDDYIGELDSLHGNEVVIVGADGEGVGGGVEQVVVTDGKVVDGETLGWGADVVGEGCIEEPLEGA